MADNDKPDAPDDTPDADDTPDTPPTDDKPDTGDEAAKWKALARKHEKEAKANAAKVKEFEDASKSDAERLTERADTAEKRATTAEATALRYEVALDKGLPKSLAVRLQGATREELETDADQLLETLGGGNGNGRKPPSFDAGPKTPAPEGGDDMNTAIRRAAGRA